MGYRGSPSNIAKVIFYLLKGDYKPWLLQRYNGHFGLAPRPWSGSNSGAQSWRSSAVMSGLGSSGFVLGHFQKLQLLFSLGLGVMKFQGIVNLDAVWWLEPDLSHVPMHIRILAALQIRITRVWSQGKGGAKF